MYKQCYTARSAIARLPSIECSLQEATYLSTEGRTVVCPVVPELASNFNWCGSQNLVVSVALSSSYIRFVHQSSHSVQHILQETSLLECFFHGLKVSDNFYLFPWREFRGPIRSRIYNTYTTVTMDLSWKTTPLPWAAPSGSGGFPR